MKNILQPYPPHFVDRFGHEMYKIHFQPTKGKGCAIFDRKDEQFDFVSKDTC